MSIYFVLALNLLIGTMVQASRVVLALYALQLGAQPITIGILAAAFSIGPMMLAVTTGRLADRYGARWPLVVGTACGGLGMLLAHFVPGLPAMFVAAMMIGVASAVHGVSLQNLVGLLSKPENRAQNFSNYSLTSAITNMMGPLIAGFSIEHVGHAYACLILVLLSAVPVAMLAFRRGSMRGGAPRATEKRGGLKAMLAEPGVRRVLATGSLQSTGDSLYQFYMPVYAHAIGLSPSTIGIILAMNAAAAIVVRVFLPRLIARFKEERLLAYAFFLGAASMMLIPFFEAAVVLAVISFTFGLGMGCGGPVVTMLMFGNSPPGRSGEGLGLKVTVNHFTKAVSPVVFGSIASAFGLLPVFLLNAIMLGIGGVLSQPKKKS